MNPADRMMETMVDEPSDAYLSKFDLNTTGMPDNMRRAIGS